MSFFPFSEFFLRLPTKSAREIFFVGKKKSTKEDFVTGLNSQCSSEQRRRREKRSDTNSEFGRQAPMPSYARTVRGRKIPFLFLARIQGMKTIKAEARPTFLLWGHRNFTFHKAEFSTFFFEREQVRRNERGAKMKVGLGVAIKIRIKTRFYHSCVPASADEKRSYSPDSIRWKKRMFSSSLLSFSGSRRTNSLAN